MTILLELNRRSNHFAYHQAKHGSDYPTPQVYVLSPSDERLSKLKSLFTSEVTGQIRDFVHSHHLEHGFSEKIAELLASKDWLRPLQQLAEQVTHPHTPKKLRHINEMTKKFS